MKITRIYHTWDKWECYPAGFYENKHSDLSSEECKNKYIELLTDLALFKISLERVITEWVKSCEHYLTNEKMNRIAWLGQASLCIQTGIPSKYKSAYFSLSKQQQIDADNCALEYLNKWLTKNNYECVDLIGAGVKSHADIY